MKKGFTLLEIVIVIIIIGVLASLALPRLFSVVEGARAAEALATISTIRASMERCYLMNNGSYAQTDINRACRLLDARYGWKGNFLDIEDPRLAPNAHFIYNVASHANGYRIWVERRFWRSCRAGRRDRSSH